LISHGTLLTPFIYFFFARSSEPASRAINNRHCSNFVPKFILVHIIFYSMEGRSNPWQTISNTSRSREHLPVTGVAELIQRFRTSAPMSREERGTLKRSELVEDPWWQRSREDFDPLHSSTKGSRQNVTLRQSLRQPSDIRSSIQQGDGLWNSFDGRASASFGKEYYTDSSYTFSDSEEFHEDRILSSQHERGGQLSSANMRR
jgi:hypothetical protein